MATKIDKLAVTINGLLPVIEKSIASEWKPSTQKNEISYRDDLLAFLREVVPTDTKLEKEYRHCGTTMDIWLEWKGFIFNGELAFELKLNLNKKTDYDRLIGQLEGMKPEKNMILIVLMGDTDKALLGRLQEKYMDKINDDSPAMAIIVVPVAE